MKPSVFLLAIATGFLAQQSAYADPENVIYDLQQKCVHRADAWFTSEFGNGIESTKDGEAVHGFRNHYSARLKKCFVLTTRTHLNNKDKQADRATDTLETLFDMSDNTEYGQYSEKNGQPLACYLEDRKCSSRTEWEALLKAYLET